MAAPNVSAQFNLDSESADFKKLVLSDITDWASEGYTEADMRGYFSVTFPDGTMRVGSTGTPDVDWSAPTTEFKIDMALVIGGGVQVGLYKIEYYAFEVGSPGTLLSFTKDVNFEPYEGVFDCSTGKVKDPTVEIIADCFYLVVSGNNTTDFGYTAGVTGSSIVHSLTLHYPSIAATADLVVASTYISSPFTWSNAPYEFIADSLVTYFAIGAAEPNFTILIRVKASVSEIVKCDVDLCNTIECFARFVAYITDEASLKGGFFSLPQTTLADFVRANSLFMLVTQNQKCGNYAEAKENAEDLEKILKRYIGNCACACKNTGKPIQITPPASSATLLTAIGIYPVIVTFLSGVLTVSLDPAFVALVATITSAVLQSTDGSITISSGTVGSTTTWTLSGVQFLAFKVRIQYTVFPITYTVSEISKRGTNWESTDPVVENATAVNLAALRALMAQFFVVDYSTTGLEKAFLEVVEIKPRSGVTALEPSQVRLEIVSQGSNVSLRLVDAVDGLPVSMSRFIDDIQYIDFNLLFIK